MLKAKRFERYTSFDDRTDGMAMKSISPHGHFKTILNVFLQAWNRYRSGCRVTTRSFADPTMIKVTIVDVINLKSMKTTFIRMNKGS